MDAAAAIDEALLAGLKVRGDAHRQVASASLVMHASRTLDPEPFLARGEALVGPALDSFRKSGRQDLELRVALWLADAGRDVPVSERVEGPLSAYRKARAWAAGQGGAENLLWIRDVPRDEATAQILFDRLFDHALAAGEDARGPAQAVLEAALADFARPAAYGLIFRATAVSESTEVVDRALAGLGTVHPAHDNAAGRRALDVLRKALSVERFEADRAALEVAVQARRDDIIQGGLGPHLAAALGRKLLEDGARALLEDGKAAGGAAARVCAAYVARQLDGPRAERDGITRKLLASKEPPKASDIVAGACEAARAVRGAWPTVDAARALSGDSIGPLATAASRASFQRALFSVGGEAAAATGDRESVEQLARTLRGGGLAPSVETYLRATLADAAAAGAARSGDPKGLDLARRLAAQSRDKFERAKMSGRAAMEFVRASEVPPMPVRWLDPLFGAASG
jgi:hypothetical protein